MAKEYLSDLIAQLNRGKISRREFASRAAVAGLSVGLIGQVIRATGVSAQDGELPPSATLGDPNYEHSTDTSAGTIKLYSSWPLTGIMELTGGDAAEAARMCIEDFGGAAGGFALDYEALDDGVAANQGGWEAGQETENANQAVNNPDCMVYLGTYNSGAAQIAIPILNQVEPAPLAMISFANTYPGLTKAIEGATEPGEPDVFYPSGIRNYMRVCPSDEIQGGAGARWAFNDMGRTRAYVLHDNSLYGEGVANVFQQEFANLGGEVLGYEGFDPRAAGYQALMTSVANAGPDVFYLGATVENNAAVVLQDLRNILSNEETIFLGSDGVNSQAFVDGAADAADGAYITFGGYTPDKLLEEGGPGADFVERITERLGHPPDAYAVYSYEAMMVTIQAIGRAGEKDRGAILDAMMATEGFNSLLGFTWSFTETGDPDSAVIGLSQVQGSNIVFQQAIM
jgi:branched-chain amino acid transport system substrate-binding protein